jgi:GR25 family glycosyltransferase involved in LPS biosynthesis
VFVVAHPVRTKMAEQLASQVGDDIIWDSDHSGCERTHAKALHEIARINPRGDDDGWAVVLEDDAEPVRNFRHQLDAILKVAPTPIVSLYLGTGYPTHWQHILQTAVNPAHTDPHFLLASEMLSMVGYAVKTKLAPWLADRVERNAKIMCADRAVSTVCREQKLTVAYTRPSIVNHRDTGSLIPTRFDGQPRDKARRAWKFGSRSEWKPITVTLDEPKLVRVDERGEWYEVPKAAP